MGIRFKLEKTYRVICGKCREDMTKIKLFTKTYQCPKCKNIVTLPRKVNKLNVDSINRYWVELYGD